MDLAVIPECYVDTNLTETITSPGRGFNHQKGCGTVAKVMQVNFSDSFALGIIDKDKKDLDYLRQFTVIAQHRNLTLLKHPNRHHYFIQISPAIETFILECAAEGGLSMGDYDLPGDLNSLCKVSKSINSKNDPKFKSLFREMKRRNVSQVARLSAWIDHLRMNTYNADLNVLRNI
jgi:hypothetical protein